MFSGRQQSLACRIPGRTNCCDGKQDADPQQPTSQRRSDSIQYRRRRHSNHLNQLVITRPAVATRPPQQPPHLIYGLPRSTYCFVVPPIFFYSCSATTSNLMAKIFPNHTTHCNDITLSNEPIRDNQL